MSCGCPNTIVDQVQYPNGFMAGPCTMLPGYQSVYDPLTAVPVGIEQPSMASPAPVAPVVANVPVFSDLPAAPVISADAPVVTADVPVVTVDAPVVSADVPVGIEAGLPAAIGASATYSSWPQELKNAIRRTMPGTWAWLEKYPQTVTGVSATVGGASAVNGANWANWQERFKQAFQGTGNWGKLNQFKIRGAAVSSSNTGGYVMAIVLILILAVAAFLFWKRQAIMEYFNKSRQPIVIASDKTFVAGSAHRRRHQY